MQGFSETVNEVFSKEIVIFYNQKTLNKEDILLSFLIDDGINHVIHLQNVSLSKCTHILREHTGVQLKKNLQEQFDQHFHEGKVSISEKFEFSYDSNTFISESNQSNFKYGIFVKMQGQTKYISALKVLSDNFVENYKEILDLEGSENPELKQQFSFLEFGYNSDENSSSIIGNPSYHNYGDQVEIMIACFDGYTYQQDVLTINIVKVPQIILLTWVVTIISTLISLFGLYKYRGILYNIFCKSRYTFEPIFIEPEVPFQIQLLNSYDKLEEAYKIYKNFKDFNKSNNLILEDYFINMEQMQINQQKLLLQVQKSVFSNQIKKMSKKQAETVKPIESKFHKKVNNNNNNNSNSEQQQIQEFGMTSNRNMLFSESARNMDNEEQKSQQSNSIQIKDQKKQQFYNQQLSINEPQSNEQSQQQLEQSRQGGYKRSQFGKPSKFSQKNIQSKESIQENQLNLFESLQTNQYLYGILECFIIQDLQSKENKAIVNKMKIKGYKLFKSWDNFFIESVYNPDINAIDNPFPFHRVKSWNLCLFLMDEIGKLEKKYKKTEKFDYNLILDFQDKYGEQLDFDKFLVLSEVKKINQQLMKFFNINLYGLLYILKYESLGFTDFSDPLIQTKFTKGASILYKEQEIQMIKCVQFTPNPCIGLLKMLNFDYNDISSVQNFKVLPWIKLKQENGIIDLQGVCDRYTKEQNIKVRILGKSDLILRDINLIIKYSSENVRKQTQFFQEIQNQQQLIKEDMPQLNENENDNDNESFQNNIVNLESEVSIELRGKSGNKNNLNTSDKQKQQINKIFNLKKNSNDNNQDIQQQLQQDDNIQVINSKSSSFMQQSQQSIQDKKNIKSSETIIKLSSD